MEERDQQVQASNFSLNEQDGNCVKDKCPLMFSCRVELITNLPKRLHFDTALYNRFKAYCIFEQRGSNIGNQRSTNIFLKTCEKKKHILCKNKRRRNFFIQTVHQYLNIRNDLTSREKNIYLYFSFDKKSNLFSVDKTVLTMINQMKRQVLNDNLK